MGSSKKKTLLNKLNDNMSVTSRYQNGDYLENSSDWHVQDSPWKARQIKKIIDRNKLSLTSVCEIGCGAGEILSQLSKMPCYKEIPFYGYEVSKTAFEMCKKRETDDLKFYYKDLLSEKFIYDVVLCIDVFEHVENYIGFLQKLKEKGKFKIFHIPLDLSLSAIIRRSLVNGRKSVGHLHYFTPDTALATLMDCGHEIIDVMFTPSFAAVQPKSLKGKFVKIPRLILYSISPRLMSTLIGGASLMVLTK